MARHKKDSFHKRARWFGKGSKSRKVLVACVLSLAGILLAGALGYYQLLNWLQGAGFCETLARAIRNQAQAEQVDVPSPLSINGNRVAVPAIYISRKGLIGSVGAKRISSEIEREALLNRQLVFNKLTIEELALMLDTSRANEKLPPVDKVKKGFWSRFAPSATIVKAFECKDTDVSVLIGGEPCALAGASVTAIPNPQLGKGAWQVNLENGRLRTPLYYLQDCSIKNAALLFSPERLHLNECRIQLTPGELRLKGIFERKSERWSGTLRANKANVVRLLKGDWKKRITGELYGELELTGKGREITTGKGIISLQQGVLEGLPLLSDLGWGSNRPYRSLQLEKAECRISFPYRDTARNISAAWLFDRIDIRSKGGSLLIRGHVLIGTDKSLGGTLNIGVPESLPEKLGINADICSQLFTGTGESGYCWLNMNLSGTVDNPQEDLSVRLSTLVGKILPGMATNAVKAVGKTIRNILPNNNEDASPYFPVGEDEEAPEGEENTPHPADEATPNSGIRESVENVGKGVLQLIF